MRFLANENLSKRGKGHPSQLGVAAPSIARGGAPPCAGGEQDWHID